MNARNTVIHFLSLTLVVLATAAARGEGNTPAATQAYPGAFFDKADYIVVGKVAAVNDTTPPTAEITSERCLWAQGGGGIAALKVRVPGPDAQPTVSCKVGDEGIWIVGKKPEDPLIYLPKSETDKLTAALGDWMDKKLTTLSAAMAKESQDKTPFATPEAQQLAKDYVPLLQAERFLTRPMTFDLTAKRLTAIYKGLGIELGFPLNPQTDEEIAAAMKVALTHPMYRMHPPALESPQYKDIQKNISMLACLWCESALRNALTLREADFKQLQEQLRGTPASADSKLDTRVELLAEMMRLTSTGQLPAK